MDEKLRIEPDETLDQLLDRVERGEEITISRNGETVARLIPAESAPRLSQAEAEELFERMDKLHRSFSLGDGVKFKDLIHAGHKY